MRIQDDHLTLCPDDGRVLRLIAAKSSAVGKGRRDDVRDTAIRVGRTPQAGQPWVAELPGRVGLEMVPIPPGTFQMGSPACEEDRLEDETLHRVTISKPFGIGRYPVTQAQWKAVMKEGVEEQVRKMLHDDTLFVYLENKTMRDYFRWDRDMPPRELAGVLSENNPIVWVSWNEAVEFCKRLSELNARYLPAGYVYTLPTEAQWEYACRAGTIGPYAGTGKLDEMGWYAGNSERATHPVGQKQANDFGLFDMHGNVWEWCLDWYDSDYLRNSTDTDPKGPASGNFHVIRGGSWLYTEQFCRSAFRLRLSAGNRFKSLGFRLAVSTT